MPYGKRSVRKRTRFSTRTAKRVAVPKKPKTTKKYVRSNALAVNSNHRAIMRMQRELKGPVQMNNQVTSFPPQIPPLPGTPTPFMTLRNDRPICCDIGDFSCQTPASTVLEGCAFYQYNNATPAVLSKIACWGKAPFVANPYFKGANADNLLDVGQYTPLSIQLTIKIQASPNVANTRIRFDLVSLKSRKIYQSTTGFQDLLMPQGVRWFEDLASPERNSISKTFFKVYATKWVTLDSRTRYTQGGGAGGGNVIGHTSTTQNFRYVSFFVRPKKDRTQSTTSTTAPADFSVYNVPQDQPLWLICSTSDVNDDVDSDQIQLTMRRKIRWRDTLGSSSM